MSNCRMHEYLDEPGCVVVCERRDKGDNSVAENCLLIRLEAEDVVPDHQVVFFRELQILSIRVQVWKNGHTAPP
jgi:hypothetical protein